MIFGNATHLKSLGNNWRSFSNRTENQQHIFATSFFSSDFPKFPLTSQTTHRHSKKHPDNIIFSISDSKWLVEFALERFTGYSLGGKMLQVSFLGQ